MWRYGFNEVQVGLRQTFLLTVRGVNRQPPGSEGTKSQVCDLRVFAPHHEMRKERDPNFSHLKTASQKLFALLSSMFLEVAGKVQARRALPQADWQAPFQLLSDITRVFNHAATLHVVATDPSAATAALAAWWVHSLMTMCVTLHAAPIVHERYTGTAVVYSCASRTYHERFRTLRALYNLSMLRWRALRSARESRDRAL